MELAKLFDALDDVPNLRSATFDDLEITESDGGLKFQGHAAVFDEEADLGDFTESVERGAFRKVLASSPNVPLLHEHRPDQLLATTRSGRLKLIEDARGLLVEANLVKTDLSERIRALVESGDIRGMSYGFICGRGNSKLEQRGDKPHRRLQNFKKLLDVTTTWDPAYVTTEAQFRSMSMQYADSPESLQQLLMGAYPQLVERAEDTGGKDETVDTAKLNANVRDNLNAIHSAEPRATGAVDHNSVAARRRALQFLVLTTGGIDDETR